MALDPYSPCPCGSGKKFKWCCQPIHVQIDKAFQQDAEGQHEVALRLMAEVVQEHPANPEAWGRQAQLLYWNDRVEEAEAALQKALDINPNYPFGHLLRGQFRYNEGEIPGALLLYRKAADLYDPEARSVLAQLYALIGDCELKLNRPVAARAAYQIALHLQPSLEDLRKGFESLFGPESRLPLSARQEYKFQSPSGGVAAERRAAWDKALVGAGTTRLSDAARAFEQLTRDDETDAAAWYNLALAKAWLGDNRAALEALDRYVALEADEAKAGAAWALAEVLRCGQGLEEQADYVEHSFNAQVRDPEALFALFDEWQKSRRFFNPVAREQEGILTAMILEPGPAVLTGGVGAPQSLRLGAYLLVAGGIFRLWNPNKEALDRIVAEVQQRAATAFAETRRSTGPVMFGDVAIEALTFPTAETDRDVVEQRIRENAERYFEDTWVHRPLRSLSSVPPLDAAGSGNLRKKLVGVVRFLQECAAGGVLHEYDFDRLRRKLGLIPGGTGAAGAAAGASADIGAMGAGELSGLKVEELTDEQLEQAYQTAVKLDAHELGKHLAAALVARPPRADRPDRFPWYSYLVQRSLAGGSADEALNYVNEGERADCEHNEGRRRNDFEQQRARVHVKRGETGPAQEVFERLIERVPTNLRYRSGAAEGMLSLKQGAAALRFAEQGLAKAREQNDRDSEQHFLELVAAAKKQSG